MAISEPNKRRGEEIAQSFLDTHGDNISIVATRRGASCVASRKLRISESSYTDPAGEVVPFAKITRSPAASIQAIARPGDPIAFRIQLKYAPERTKPIEMTIDDRSVDLANALEISGDSLLLVGDVALMLTEALRRDASPVLRATSRITGRLVADRIAAPDMTGLEACLDTLKEMQVQDQPGGKAVDGGGALDSSKPDTAPSAEITPIDDPVQDSEIAATEPSMSEKPEETEDGRSLPALPTPVTGIRVDFVARPDPEARIFPDKLADCRMRDIPETVFLGRLTSVTGFFSQTPDVYVAFDDHGKVQRVYIPGIFDSDLTTAQSRARVSLAADSNLPDQPNTVRGCLGDAPLEAPVCVISREGGDRYNVAECGVLGMSETREDFLSSLLEQNILGATNSMTLSPANPTTLGTPLPFGDQGQTFFRRFTGQDVLLPRLTNLGSDTPGPFVFDESELVPNQGTDPLPSVPLPAAFWMMMGSLVGLFLLRSQGEKNICRQTG